MGEYVCAHKQDARHCDEGILKSLVLFNNVGHMKLSICLSYQPSLRTRLDSFHPFSGEIQSRISNTTVMPESWLCSKTVSFAGSK